MIISGNIKYPLIFTLVFITIFGIKAQKYTPFDTANISWNESYVYGDDQPLHRSISNYYVSGDTLIENSLYHKIYQVYDDDTIYMGAFMESGRKVLYTGIDYGGFDTDTSVILYDFTKNIGDTVHTGTFHLNIINDIDSISIFEGYRKRFKMDDDQYWIEGIGSTKGFLYPMADIPTMDWHPELVCFKHNGDLIYLNPGFIDCTTLISSVNDHEAKDIVEIYPNPVEKESVLSIKTARTSIARIQLFNQMGILILTSSYNNKNDIRVKVPNCTPGIYYLLIFKSEQTIFQSEKIIIN